MYKAPPSLLPHKRIAYLLIFSTKRKIEFHIFSPNTAHSSDMNWNRRGSRVAKRRREPFLRLRNIIKYYY